MRAFSSWIWQVVLALAVTLALGFGGGAAFAQQESPVQRQEAQAQRQQVQPGNNAPVWREVRKEGAENYTSIKGRETGVLIQPYSAAPTDSRRQRQAATSQKLTRAFWRNQP